MRLTQERLQPRLQGYGLVRDGRTWATVRNTGGTAAEAAHIMLVAGSDGFVTTIGDGFLRPGEGLYVASPILSVTREADVVMYCRDQDMVLRAWSAQGGRKVYRSRIFRRRTYPANNVIFNDFYPSVDLKQITEYPVKLVPWRSLGAKGTECEYRW